MQNVYLRSIVTSDISLDCEGAASQDVARNFSIFSSECEELHHVDADNVAILDGSRKGGYIAKDGTMSALRMCCFITSLLACVVTVIGFVWLVPCSEKTTCPALVERIKTQNWFNNCTKIELKGGINVVGGQHSQQSNFIFLYRGDEFFTEFKASNSKRNGIISLDGRSGAVTWFDETTNEPVSIDCTLLDADRNGQPECLVIDEYGGIGVINPISGQWYWLFKDRPTSKVGGFYFPVILPDLDSDGIMDILVITTEKLQQRLEKYSRNDEMAKQGQQDYGSGHRNVLRILSGYSGQPIGRRLQMQECDELRELQLETMQTVSFICVRNNTEEQRYKTLAELFALITNKSLLNQKLISASKIPQYRHMDDHKDVDSQRNIYSLSRRELMIENSGKCPKDCRVTVVLSEAREGKVNILHHFSKNAMYGMVPAQWHFKNSKNNLSGFVIKFWAWKTGNEGTQVVQNTMSGNNITQKLEPTDVRSKWNSSMRGNAADFNSKSQIQNGRHTIKALQGHQELNRKSSFSKPNTFDNFVQKRHTYTTTTNGIDMESSGLANAVTQRLSGGLLGDKSRMQIITESLVLVLFVGSETRVENASQSNIVQFCRTAGDGRGETTCQPDLRNQENSLLVVDLDEDGSQELVSYMSTFVQVNDNPTNWRLFTYVHLLHLQPDLSTLSNLSLNN